MLRIEIAPAATILSQHHGLERDTRIQVSTPRSIAPGQGVARAAVFQSICSTLWIQLQCHGEVMIESALPCSLLERVATCWMLSTSSDSGGHRPKTARCHVLLKAELVGNSPVEEGLILTHTIFLCLQPCRCPYPTHHKSHFLRLPCGVFSVIGIAMQQN